LRLWLPDGVKWLVVLSTNEGELSISVQWWFDGKLLIGGSGEGKRQNCG
jgi:hypothetical protein